MKAKRILTGITALALCLVIPFLATAEIISRDILENGKIKERIWTDENGEPAEGPGGYASVRYTYKASNTFEEYYGTDGELFHVDGQYCGRRVEKDGKGRVVAIEYLDEKGKRTENGQGYAQVITSYTSFGEIRQICYYGQDKKPRTVPSLGYASITNEYSNKTLVSRTFKNAKGKPVDSVDGYAVMKQKTDKDKKYQVVSIRYDHADGSPATGPDGWFRCVKDRDNNGRLLSVKYYDEQSQLTDRGAGYAWEEYTYEGKNIIKTTRYGLDGEVVTDGSGIATTVREMNDDKVVRECFLDRDGKRISNGLGIGAILYSYDQQGRLERVDYQDTEGKPANCSKGYAGYRDTKDADGATASRTFLGTDGNAVEIPGGYSEIRYIYDETKQLSSTQYYDLNGKQIRAE